MNRGAVRIMLAPPGTAPRHIPCAACNGWVWVEEGATLAVLDGRETSALSRSRATSSGPYLEARLRGRLGRDLEVIALSPQDRMVLVAAAPLRARAMFRGTTELRTYHHT